MCVRAKWRVKKQFISCAFDVLLHWKRPGRDQKEIFLPLFVAIPAKHWFLSWTFWPFSISPQRNNSNPRKSRTWFAKMHFMLTLSVRESIESVLCWSSRKLFTTLEEKTFSFKSFCPGGKAEGRRVILNMANQFEAIYYVFSSLKLGAKNWSSPL